MTSTSTGLASIFSDGYLSSSAPVSSLQISASHSFLNKHYKSNSISAVFSCLSSRVRKLSYLSSKVDLSQTTTTSSIHGYPKYDRLLPCPLDNGSSRVEQLVVSEGGPVLDYICKTLDLPPLFVADLIHFGAVYYALVCPQPPPSATPEQMRIYKEATAPLVLSKRASIRGKTLQEAQKTFRITHVEQFVEAGTYLRVHVHPKRFPRCYEIDWKSRIIAVTDSYVVLDKPAGISVGGTRDNIEECCATFTSRALGFSTPLKTTHQIDNCTEGCVVLARTKEYCSVFHGKIREKQVKKLYLALTAAPAPIGIITHYMRPINIAPRLVSEAWSLYDLQTSQKDGTCANLRLSNARRCPGQILTFRKTIVLSTPSGLRKIVLVRAQLAASGAPIVGDSMYMPAAIAEMENPELNPFGKHNKYTSETDKEMAVTNWIAQFGKEPSVAIGLQACQISWDDGEHFYEARSPWWRSRLAYNCIR